MGCTTVHTDQNKPNSNIIPKPEVKTKFEETKFELIQLNSIRDKFEVKSVLSFDSNRALYALKSISDSNATYYARIFSFKSSDSQLNKIKKRIKSIEDLRLPCIIPYTHIASNETHIYCVMQTTAYTYYSTETIISRLIEDEGSLKKALKGVFEALATLHSQNIMHGEIGPEKLLYGGDKFALCDFTMGVETVAQLFIASDQKLVAPEIRNGYLPSIKSDVWELGATIKYLLDTTRISSELEDLLNKMTKKDEKERITILQALAHEWFKGALNEPSKRITYNSEAESQLRTSRIILNVVNLMANKVKELNVNELRFFMKLMDEGDIGLIDFSIFMTYMVEKKLLEQNTFSIENDFLVNYTDLLCSVMALGQFIKQERCIELFGQLAEGSLTVTKEAIRGLLISSGLEVYVNSEDNIESFIQGHQIDHRSEYDLTYHEFMMLIRYLDLEITEYILIDRLVVK